MLIKHLKVCLLFLLLLLLILTFREYLLPFPLTFYKQTCINNLSALPSKKGTPFWHKQFKLLKHFAIILWSLFWVLRQWNLFRVFDILFRLYEIFISLLFCRFLIFFPLQMFGENKRKSKTFYGSSN